MMDANNNNIGGIIIIRQMMAEAMAQEGLNSKSETEFETQNQIKQQS